ncbi:hypothetical protein EV401DRAFT_1880111, partial [Pisolithus croceorrhizus]
LSKHNPEISWSSKTIKLSHCPQECNDLHPRSRAEREAKKHEAEEYIYPRLCSTHVCARTAEELVPREYHHYLKVFSKEESESVGVSWFYPFPLCLSHRTALHNTFPPLRLNILPLSHLRLVD